MSGGSLAHLREAGGAIGDRRHLEPFVLEVVADELDDIFIVFDDQDSSWAHYGLEPLI